MKAYLESYGCAHNESDARIIRSLLVKHGATVADSPEKANFIFINTCGVKHTTELRMLSRIRELSKNSATLAVCGCLPKINEKAVRKAAPRAYLLDTDSLGKIGEFLASPRDIFSESRVNKLILSQPEQGLVAMVQIGEGCLGKCSFCGTKNARGRLYSYPMKDVLLAAESAVARGAREVCLTSEDTGCYGMDMGSSLPELLESVSGLDGDFRVRVGMMNPNHALRILPGLLKAYKSEKIYKFAHLPVQSGSDKVLWEMRRNYSVKDFEHVVSEFRRAFPEMTISTDVIVGFPTETEEDFEKTMELLDRVRPDIANVSKFGPRPGTEAAKMRQLSSQTVKQRSVRASRLAKELSLESNRREMGRELLAFGLFPGKRGGTVGRTENYRQVVFEGEPGKKYPLRVTSAHLYYLKAKTLK